MNGRATSSEGPLRVVQLLPALEEGGVERGVVDMNRELVRDGFESVVISAGGRLVKTIEEDGGWHIPLDVARKNPFTFLGQARMLRRALRHVSPDLVHVRSRLPAWLLRVANRRLQIPHVTTVHGFNHISAYSRIMTRGERVICPSRAVKTYIQKHYSTPEDKIIVIPRGVDIHYFDPERTDDEKCRQFHKTFQLKNGFIVAFPGRLSSIKGHKTFIRAVALARRYIPSLIGLIVGGAVNRTYLINLHNLSRSLDVQEAIRFIGNQQDMREIFAISDVVVSASTRPESFGRTAAEALAMNRPVIATRHGGILDLVKENQTGFLFKPNDHDTLAHLIRRAHERDWDELRSFILERFTLKQMFESTRDVYREVLREHGRRL